MANYMLDFEGDADKCFLSKKKKKKKVPGLWRIQKQGLLIVYREKWVHMWEGG